MDQEDACVQLRLEKAAPRDGRGAELLGVDREKVSVGLFGFRGRGLHVLADPDLRLIEMLFLAAHGRHTPNWCPRVR